MQIKRIALGGIIMTVIMFSGCSTTVQNLAIGEEKTLEKELVLQEGLQAPIQKGQQIGEVIIKQNGAELCRTPAVSAGDITQLNLMECVRRIAKWWIH